MGTRTNSERAVRDYNYFSHPWCVCTRTHRSLEEAEKCARAHGRALSDIYMVPPKGPTIGYGLLKRG